VLGGALCGGLCCVRSVDWATYLVVFVVYSNLAVVAVKFHGVPALAANAVVGLLALPVLTYSVLQNRGVVLGRAGPWIAGFTLVQLLGALGAVRPDLSWGYFQTYLLEGLLLYLLLVNAVRTRSALRGAVWALLAAGCLMGGVPVVQQLTGQFDNTFGGLGQTGDEPGFETAADSDDDDLQRRLAGPIGEKNRYAQIMLMLIPAALFRWRDERTGLGRWAAAAALLLATAGGLLAFSRAAIVAAGLVVWLAAALGYLSRRAVALSTVLALVALLASPQYRARLASFGDLGGLLVLGRHADVDPAVKGRATEMGAAALVFLDHPLTGVGPGMFRQHSQKYGERIGLRDLPPDRQAHCLLLDVAAENGAPGVVCLLGVFGTLLGGLYEIIRTARQTTRGTEEEGLAAGFLFMLAVYFVTGLFLHFAFIRYFWLMVALSEAVLALRDEPIVGADSRGGECGARALGA
jgi:O-antigen ligase